MKRFQQIIVEIATLPGGQQRHNSDYFDIRCVVVNANVAMVPDMIRLCEHAAGLFRYIQQKASTYALRSAYIHEQFAPLLAILESYPCDDPISDVITAIGIEDVKKIWQSCLERRSSDPKGAITLAQTLLETVCKYIIGEPDQKSKSYPSLGDLYYQVSMKLGIHPSQAIEDDYKKVCQGFVSVIQPLTSIRNACSDAHSTKEDADATLIVNVAGTVAAFMISRWNDRPEADDNPFSNPF